MTIEIIPQTKAIILPGWNKAHLATKGSKPPQNFSDNCLVTIWWANAHYALCGVGESRYLIQRKFIHVEKSK